MLVGCQKLHFVHITDKIFPVTLGSLLLSPPKSGGARTAAVSPIKHLTGGSASAVPVQSQTLMEGLQKVAFSVFNF